MVQEEGIVSSSQLLNVTCELARKISADDAQTFIKSLIKHHWLEEVRCVALLQLLLRLVMCVCVGGGGGGGI